MQAINDHHHGHHADDTMLGMDSAIPRADMADGRSVGMAVTDRATAWPIMGEAPGETYPPALTGMRGSGYPRAFANGHAMREGWLFDAVGTAAPDPDQYDLVVVGAGISGLSAAYFFQKTFGRDMRILILDNHDDVGGHAKRNEFTVGGDTRISNAGTFNLYSPGTDAEKDVFDALGIRVDELAATTVDTGFYARQGMGQSVFFDKETFGQDLLLKDPAPWTDFTFLYNPNVPPDAAERWQGFLKNAPLPQHVRQQVYDLYHLKPDYWPGLSVAQKTERLNGMTYVDFLRDVAGCDPLVWLYMRDRSFGSGRGLSSITALMAYQRFGFPGMDGLGLPAREGKNHGHAYHFPDGNATIVRLMVRHLNAAALPGTTVADSIQARMDHAALDQPTNAVNIRLNATVVNAHNHADGAGVDVTYMTDDRMRRVSAKACVMACWFHVVPYLCPDMPLEQREALHYNVHTPNLWVNVWLRNWEAFHKAGVCLMNAPNGYYASLALEFPISVGGYRHAQDPSQPISLTMLRGYGQPGLHIKDQFRLGRIEMYETTLETYEREARKQLQAALGPYGFEAARDILGITVNRWGHGYSYWYSPLYDEFARTGAEPPHLRARVPFGRIAIAGAGASGTNTTAQAINMAARAVQDLAHAGVKA